MIDIRFDIFERRNNGDCSWGVWVRDDELVLYIEDVVEAMKAMDDSSDAMKGKLKVQRKIGKQDANCLRVKSLAKLVNGNSDLKSFVYTWRLYL